MYQASGQNGGRREKEKEEAEVVKIRRKGEDAGEEEDGLEKEEGKKGRRSMAGKDLLGGKKGGGDAVSYKGGNRVPFLLCFFSLAVNTV